MQLTITLDTNCVSTTEATALRALFDHLAGVKLAGQPEVSSNTGTVASATTFPAEGNGVSAGVADEPAAPAPEKRTRKPKPADPAPAPAPEGGGGPVEPTKAPTLDEVRAALQGYTARHSIEDGIELLKEFKAGRISELKADDYTAFVAKCGGVEA